MVLRTKEEEANLEAAENTDRQVTETETTTENVTETIRPTYDHSSNH